MSRLSALISDSRRFGVSAAVGALRARYAREVSDIELPGFGRFQVRGKDSDFSTLRQVFGDQEYRVRTPAVEDRIAARYRDILASGKTPVVIDAGANIGAASRWFGGLFPQARVIAVEPDADNARILRLNAADYPMISTVEAAIGAAAGFVSLSHPGNSWGIQTERSAAGCPVVTVADLMASTDQGVLFLVKVDIEGFEDDLFSNNVDWLDQAFCVVIEPHDWMLPDRHTSRAFQREMGLRDFQLLIQGENLLYVRR